MDKFQFDELLKEIKTGLENKKAEMHECISAKIIIKYLIKEGMRCQDRGKDLRYPANEEWMRDNARRSIR